VQYGEVGKDLPMLIPWLTPRRESGGVSIHGVVSWCQPRAGGGGSQGFPVMASPMASSAVMPWAAAESR
jgi:hypothetical protein